MRLILGLNDRYCRTPDGRVWTDAATWSYELLRRYLAVFPQVVAVARVRPAAIAPPGTLPADGPGVEFADVPYFVGPLAYLKRRQAVQEMLSRVIQRGDAVVLRLPAWLVTSVLADRLPARDYPYAVEVCGDGAAQLTSGAAGRPWRRWIGHVVAGRSRTLCRQASAALFVTQRHLQQRYPPADDAFCVSGCSNVDLPPEAFCRRPRTFAADGPRRLVFVGSLAKWIKGADVLIDAVSQCRAAGESIKLTVIGDGRQLDDLRLRARRRGVAAQVHFLGRLAGGAAIREQLDLADMFVLPSRSEGLPRSLLEAMARGLPCVATRVGGVPELLDEACLVKPGCSRSLAEKLLEFCHDAPRLTTLSARNHNVAQQFAADRLTARRIEFLTAVQSRTQAWLDTHAAPAPRDSRRGPQPKAA